jgi:hypothetical protein
VQHIRTTLDIDAPPAKVWSILADLAHWDDWNPIIRRVRGRVEADAPIDFSLRLGKRAVPIQARMLRVEPERELCWKGPRARALAPIFAGEHYFAVEPLDAGRTRFVHGERFTGLLVPVLWRRLEPALLRGYAKVNEALKRRAEAAS